MRYIIFEDGDMSRVRPANWESLPSSANMTFTGSLVDCHMWVLLNGELLSVMNGRILPPEVAER